jgi:hypothetical protein
MRSAGAGQACATRLGEGDGRQVLGVPRGDDAGRQGRALTFQWDETNACIRVALGDTFGEHRHPGSRRNGQQDPVDLTVWHLDQRRRNAGGAARRQHGVIERPVGIPGEHDDAFWSDPLEGDVRLDGVLVTNGEHRNGSLLTEWCHANSGRRHRQRHDGDIQLAGSHRVDQVETGPRLDRRLKAGYGGGKAPQGSRDAGPQGGRDVADPQPRPVACAAGRHPRRLCLTEHSVCLREQGGPRVREGNAPLRAVEQPHPELLLELAYLL